MNISNAIVTALLDSSTEKFMKSYLQSKGPLWIFKTTGNEHGDEYEVRIKTKVGAILPIGFVVDMKIFGWFAKDGIRRELVKNEKGTPVRSKTRDDAAMVAYNGTMALLKTDDEVEP